MIPGDLFHRQPLKRELKEVSSLFAEVAPAHVVLIAGNHDYLHPRSYYRNFPWPENVHMLMDEQLGKSGCRIWIQLYGAAVSGNRKTGAGSTAGNGSVNRDFIFCWDMEGMKSIILFPRKKSGRRGMITLLSDTFTDRDSWFRTESSCPERWSLRTAMISALTDTGPGLFPKEAAECSSIR